MAAPRQKIYVVEHLDPELGAWSALEYKAIAKESTASAEKELRPEDATEFDIFLFGGILGDDPPRDRTKELRQKGFTNRRLGPVQMTTDTAVRATRMIIQQQIPLEKIPYVDHPEFHFNEHESTQMPFRYITGSDDKPILPEGMIDLIKKDSEKGFGDLL